MKKIFCSNCIYIGVNSWCFCPKNTKRSKYPDDWYKEGGEYIRTINMPEDINVNNDCKWFKQSVIK